MDFLCTDEQLELRATVRDFLAEQVGRGDRARADGHSDWL